MYSLGGNMYLSGDGRFQFLTSTSGAAPISVRSMWIGTTYTNSDSAHYIYGTAGRIFFGGNFHIDSLGTNKTYINYYSANDVVMVSGSPQGKVGIGTSSPSYKLHVTGDIYANGGWLRTSGAKGWYNESYGGGWYMTDSNFIRNYNSKAVSINIASNNAWGIGGHRLAAIFKGNNHSSILLSTDSLGYGLCVNNDGNWYWGKRTSSSETSTSGDTYLLQGNTTLVRPSTNMAIGLGQVKSSEFSNAYIRDISARHLNASGVYSGDMHLYIGYGTNTPTQKILFYYSTGTHGATATSRTQFAEINSNGLYALTRFGVNGQNTSYNLYVNGTSYFNGTVYEQGQRFIRREQWWNSGDTHNCDDLRSGVTFSYTTHKTPTTGTLVAFSCNNNEDYTLQLQGAYISNSLYFRNRNGDNSTWRAWKTIIDSSNYTSYTDPRYIRAINANGYYGMGRPDGNTTDWIRTTSNGLIPYQSGGSTGGHCSIGTSTWYFNTSYISNMYSAGLFVINDSSNNSYDGLAYFRNYSASDWTMIIDKNNAYDYGLDIRASGTMALRVNGSSRFKNSAIFGADAAPSYTVDVRGKTRSTDRIYANEWIQFDNYTGLYSPKNNAHFYPNNTTTYGQWKILGSKGGYSGIHFGDTTAYMTVMDDSNNKGLYQEGKGWIYYYNASNQRVGIRTSSLTSYAITCEGDFYCRNGWLRTNGATGWYNESYGGGWYMTDSTWMRSYDDKPIYTAGGINSPHGHNFMVGGNEFNFIPDNYNNTVWFNYQSWSRNSSSTVSTYLFGNGHGGTNTTLQANYFTGTAERAYYLSGHASNPNNSHPGHGARVFYSWNAGQVGNDNAGYSNGITIGSHPGDTNYGFQIVENMWDDRLYTRRYNGGWQSWFAIAYTSDFAGASVNYANSAGNADTLDGYHESSFLRYSGWWDSGNGKNVNDASGMIFAYSSHGLPGNWGVVTTLDYSKNSAYRHQIYGDGWNNEMYFRTCSSDRGGWNGWRHLLDNSNYASILDGRYVKKSGDTMTGNLTAPKFIGALQGNADSATKLATARTLTIGNKGKTFNGTANVSWSLSEIGAAEIETGTYVGTGQSGSSSLTTSLTFSFVPKMFIVCGIPTDSTYSFLYGNSYGYGNCFGIVCTALSSEYKYITTSRFSSIKIRINNKTVEWYYDNIMSDEKHRYQYNISGLTYAYIAIG